MDLRDALHQVFQKYDVRGTYPEPLTPEVARRAAQAFAAYLREARRVEQGRVVVGRDMRNGSDEIAAAAVRGLAAGGLAPVDLGLVSTDMVYFATGHLPNVVAGIMVTASHNPPDYNGLKFCLHEGRPIGAESGLYIIRDVAKARADEPLAPAPDAPAERRAVQAPYAARLRELAPGPFKPLRVVVDAGHGMATRIFPLVFDGVPIDVVPLNFGLDPAFGGRTSANPADPENIQELQQAVRRHGADAGMAFDGDSDRLVVVDDRGNALSGSPLTALLAQRMLTRYPGAHMIFDLSTGWAVEDVVREGGGTPHIGPVGHAGIKRLMRQHNCPFGGEHSGHYYFQDLYYSDSGMLAALTLLEILTEAPQPLSALAEPIATRYHRTLDLMTQLDSRQAALDAVHTLDVLHPDAQARRVLRIGTDLRKDFDDWWFCVRPSGTEPRFLRLSVEARTRPLAEARTAELQSHILP